ncbi:MAG: glycosyltransferase family 9 protein [Planctomycetes bacterium]|nr:glycosyltransferase family 9 protein [Planctomycetota bacterium]
MPRILVVRRGGLGDTLLMLPVLRALRREHPGAAIEFAGVREFVDVLARFGAVDRAFSAEDLRLWSVPGGDDEALRRLRMFDRIVGDDPALRTVSSATTAVNVFDPRLVVPGWPHGQTLLDQLHLEAALDEPLCERVVVGTSAPIALAPGSGGRHKCWPRACWLELAGHLRACGEEIAVVVGPAEGERDDPRRWPWPGSPRFLADLSATELAESLRRCRSFVGNDSGVTHLAAVMNVPTVAIFGPTDPTVWAPPFPWSSVLAGDQGEVASVGTADVRAALHR